MPSNHVTLATGFVLWFQCICCLPGQRIPCARYLCRWLNVLPHEFGLLTAYALLLLHRCSLGIMQAWDDVKSGSGHASEAGMQLADISNYLLSKVSKIAKNSYHMSRLRWTCCASWLTYLLCCIIQGVAHAYQALMVTLNVISNLQSLRALFPRSARRLHTIRVEQCGNGNLLRGMTFLTNRCCTPPLLSFKCTH
jgi:hypothetical protein